MKPPRRSDPSVRTRRTRSTQPPWNRRGSKISSSTVTTAGKCRPSQRRSKRKRTGGGDRRKTQKLTASERARNGDKVRGVEETEVYENNSREIMENKREKTRRV